MLRFFYTIVILFISGNTFSQRMSPEHYWIPLSDKENNSFTLNSPGEFLSDRSILRRQKTNIPIIEQDLPVSDFYIDSLKSLGLKIIGSSKWLNGVVVETSDYLLIDSLPYLDFVNNFSTEYDNFSADLLEFESNYLNVENNFTTVSDYGSSHTQLNILGGLGLHELGFRGKGLQIAVLDAGFYKVDSFGYFNNLWENNQIIAHRDLINPTGNIFRESSHGMSVLSTMSVNAPGQYIGSAPEASYILIRSEDVSRETKVEEAYWIFAAEYADSIGADIITSSLGYSKFDFPEMNYQWDNLTENTAFVTRAAEIAFSKGIIVVTSAGNEGNKEWQKINMPADGEHVLAVGSIDTAGVVSLFSSHGLEDNIIVKPDVLAVGYETSLVNSSGNIGKGFGTSYSSPQIAGFTACLWQANPDKSHDEILQAIRQSANKFSFPNEKHGYGTPDFMLAMWILNGIEPIQSNDLIQIYPNPVEDFFYIKTSISLTNIEIFTLDGKLIYKNESGWQSGEIILIDNWSYDNTGVYLLKTSNNKKTIVNKLLKK
ncbi:MAG: S8 family peptidase [Bacteroidales bacterium]|nr:S8 family peptidase [Bacteroidales bacterium]